MEREKNAQVVYVAPGRRIADALTKIAVVTIGGLALGALVTYVQDGRKKK